MGVDDGFVLVEVVVYCLGLLDFCRMMEARAHRLIDRYTKGLRNESFSMVLDAFVIDPYVLLSVFPVFTCDGN